MRVAALLLVLFATAGPVAACGGSSKGSAGGTPTAPASQNGFPAYVDCLRKNGVALPSALPRAGRPSARPSSARGAGFGLGNQPPAGVDAQTWQKAQQACASLRPSGGAQNRVNGPLRAYRNCLSDHGVTMSAGPGDLDSNDPKVAAALKACEVLRPTGRAAPSPTG